MTSEEMDIFNFYISDIRYQEHFPNPQKVKNEIKFSNALAVVGGTIGYATILTSKLLIFTTDDRTHFDLV